MNGALDVFGIDAGPRRPQRAVATRLELARRVVGQPLPVAHLRSETPHQSEPAEDEVCRYRARSSPGAREESMATPTAMSA